MKTGVSDLESQYLWVILPTKKLVSYVWLEKQTTLHMSYIIYIQLVTLKIKTHYKHQNYKNKEIH